MIRYYDCPNCGASSQDDVAGDNVRCRYCGTQIVLPRLPLSRRELELEREQILARAAEWDARIAEARAHSARDAIVPAAGCCGLYAGIFMVGSLLLAAIGLSESKTYRMVVAATAIGAALIGVVLIIRRRETRRREQLETLERERADERQRADERLRQIEADLGAAEL